jgi:hypothetical protein
VQCADRIYEGTKLPGFLQEMLLDGGLVAHRKKEALKGG